METLSALVMSSDVSILATCPRHFWPSFCSGACSCYHKW